MLTVDIKPIGVILAGGKSTRMGRDKAGLRLNGETLLSRSRDKLLATGCKKVLLSGPRRDGWLWEAIPDAQQEAGPVSGIATSIIWAHQHGLDQSVLVFVPIDTPLLSADLLAELVNKAQNGVGCAVFNAPLPNALKVTPTSVKQSQIVIAELRAGVTWSVKHFLATLAIPHLQVPDATRHQLVNTNTPVEWEALRREFENRS